MNWKTFSAPPENEAVFVYKVTHKDILSFGQSIDLKVDGILEKRLQKALNLTKKFKTKEENKLRTKMRKKLKKENTKTLKAMKKNQRLENTQVGHNLH